MRLILVGVVLLAASVLSGCASIATPSWAVADLQNYYAKQKPLAQRSQNTVRTVQRSQQDKMRTVRRGVDDAKVDGDISSIGSAPSGYEYVKPFSKEWDQLRAEETRRVDAAIAICRGC